MRNSCIKLVLLTSVILSLCNYVRAGEPPEKRTLDFGMVANYNHDWKAFGYPYLVIPKLYLKYNMRNKWSVLGQIVIWEEGTKNYYDPYFGLGKIDYRTTIGVHLGYRVYERHHVNFTVCAGLRYIHGMYIGAIIDRGKWKERLLMPMTKLNPGAVLDLNYLPLKIGSMRVGVLLNQQFYFKSFSTTSLGIVVRF